MLPMFFVLVLRSRFQRASYEKICTEARFRGVTFFNAQPAVLEEQLHRANREGLFVQVMGRAALSAGVGWGAA